MTAEMTIESVEVLGAPADVSPDPAGVVVDLATASSRRHFGVVFECRIADSVVNARRGCGNSEFTHSRRDNDYRLEEAGEFTGWKFDPWPGLLLASHYARQNFGAPRSTFAAQLPFGLTVGQGHSLKLRHQGWSKLQPAA